MSEHRLAVIDLGSNSFRLVVFSWAENDGHGWWRRTDEIYEAVRIGAGLDAAGELQDEPMERALETIELYAHFCRATGLDDVRPVATSAIREASNREAFLRAARTRSGLKIEVLSPEEEARYGYLAAVNSTTLTDGIALDLGGGSLQLTHVADRCAQDARSWKLGAVRMTERFLAGETVKRKQLKALRAHVRDELASAGWLEHAAADGASLAGIGGTVRNLAAAAELAAELPSFGVQGFVLERAALDELVETLAETPSAERGAVPGIKPERGDLILAGAVVLQTTMEIGDFETLEVTEAGLREGVFYSTLLAGEDPPLFEDVRREAVCNLAAQYHADFTHIEHVARLSLRMWDELGEAGVHPCDPRERDLLWAAAMLHDIGTAVDYDDHHKHSRYLILNASLPGHSTRETALIGQLARYHRKGNPSLGVYAKLARDGDEDLLARGAALLRVAEQLERSRDQAVHDATVSVENGQVELHLLADEDVSVARWGAERQRELFQRAFGKDLIVSSGLPVSVFWAALVGLSLLAGAVLAATLQLPSRVAGLLSAFGGGVLLAAVALELVPEADREAGTWLTAGGLLAGTLAYVAADAWLNRDEDKAMMRRAGHAAAAGRTMEMPDARSEAARGKSIAVGLFIDGVPESLALGLTIAEGEIGLALLGGILIGNVVEAYGAAQPIIAGGQSRGSAIRLLGGIGVALAASTIAGTVVDASPAFVGSAQAVAAGAVLAVVSISIVPHAFAQVSRVAALATVLGFGAGYLLSV